MPTATIAPPALSPRVQSVAELTGEWVVAEVLARHEKHLARDLASAGVGYYLPLVTHVRVLAGKRRKLVVPLYPGYLFACPADAGERYAVLDHPSVYGSLRVPDRCQDRLRRDLEMCEVGLRDKPEAGDFDWIKRGVRCVVKPGHAFQNFEGWVDVGLNRGVVQVVISILGQPAPVSIDPAFLEPLN